MTSPFEKFKNLHHQSKPLLLGNVWNVQSAVVFEKAGFDAIATSSAAIAHNLGYEDGENIPFDEYLFIVKRIVKSVQLPLSVDLEMGFARDTDGIVENISRLHELGVVGINIEDSAVNGSAAPLQDAKLFTEKLNTITRILKEKSIKYL